MIGTPPTALTDLDDYVASHKLSLSPAARRTFELVEDESFRVASYPFPRLFLWALYHSYSPLRMLIDQRAGPTAKIEAHIREDATDLESGPYEGLEGPYSGEESRHTDTRMRIIDLSIAVARRNFRREIAHSDILEALFEVHNENYPVETNDEWASEELHTSYNGLAHIAPFHRALDISFQDVLRSLERPRTPIELAPSEIRASVLKLFEDHPDYDRNCFLIMSFAASPSHSKIHQCVCDTLAQFNLIVLRADQRSYADDLLANIQTYLHGCSFGIAVFERLESDAFNANVSFEVGYLTALRKPICLLKERTLKSLHSDVAGRLYMDFDVQNIGTTLKPQLLRWLVDKKIVLPSDEQPNEASQRTNRLPRSARTTARR